MKVFDKPRAEGKSRSVYTLPRRENDCFEETNKITNLKPETAEGCIYVVKRSFSCT